AAEPVAEDRRLKGKAWDRGGHALLVDVDRMEEQSEKLVARTAQLLGNDVLLFAMRDEQSRAEDLRGVACANEGGAVEWMLGGGKDGDHHRHTQLPPTPAPR